MKPKSYKDYLKADIERRQRKLAEERDPLKRLRQMSEIGRLRSRITAKIDLTKYGDA
jgi:hypothetical protein